MRSKEATSAYRCSELGRLSLPFLLLLSLALLIPRLDGWDYAVGKYLWAEDGSVFINEAQRFGFASLWQPYQGYLHAYPRIVSYLSDFVDLSYRPIVLLLGWFIAYMFMICTLLLRSFSMGVSGLGVAIMFAAVVMQPNYGEVFFTLTNTQWFLAVGFAVILLAGEVGALKFTVFRLLGLLVLGLTGPFSVVILPVLALRAFYFKDLRTNAWIYGVTLICACVQVLVLLNSPRLSVNGGPIDWLNWSIVFVRMIFFGANTPLSWAAAVLLWIGVLLGIVRYWFAGGRDRDNAIQCLMLVVMGLLLIAACMYSAKSNLQSVLALGGGNRYTWVPYTLTLFLLFVVAKRSLTCQILIGVLWMAIALPVAHRNTSPSLQYGAFVDYSRYKDVDIPLHPMVPEIPGWHIEGVHGKYQRSQNAASYNILKAEFVATNSNVEITENGLILRSTGNDPILVFNRLFVCPAGTRSVGVEIEINRSHEGPMQIFWEEKNYFTELDSLRRWYPKGRVVAQFAFRYKPAGVLVRFDPMEQEGTAAIQHMTLVCLPKD